MRSHVLIRVRTALRGDGGFAMVMALLSVVVATLLGIVVMQLSLHATESSAYDRARTQSVHAAEAGIDRMMSLVGSSSTNALPCALTGTLTGTPVATWTVAVNYYASYPLVGAKMQCGINGYLSGVTAPAGAQMVSTGTIAGWKAGSVERHIETEVELSPVRSAFNKAIFSNASPNITNNITIYGENGNDADFLTNSDWACTQSLTVYGSIYVQGTASLSNSCRGAVDLWANGAISMSSTSRVDHDVKSSTGSLLMTQSASVGNNVTLGTTCNGCTSSNVGGTVTTNHVQAAPPSTPFPPMVFDAAAWTAEGWTIVPFTDCTLARNWMVNSANNGTKAVLRITGGCTLTIQQNTTITRTADLGIFTDGEITTSNNTTFQTGDASWHNLELIVESAASCAGLDGRITMSNQTAFTGLYFFVYSPCYSTFGQNNSTARGQIYGQVVSVANNLTYTFHAVKIPGAGDISGYTARTAFVREIN